LQGITQRSLKLELEQGNDTKDTTPLLFSLLNTPSLPTNTQQQQQALKSKNTWLV
jgi:hypothetical protein